MYASLIGAGISALSDLLGRNAATPNKDGAAFTASTDGAGGTSSSATASTGGTSGPLGTDLNKLFVDLQAAQTDAGGTDPTQTVASDLQSVSKDLAKAGGHHHHHGGGGGNPFQNAASSLLAYGRTQALGTAAGASITA